MKNLLAVSALLLVITGNALAGSEYDRCIKEEQALKNQETAQCSGLRYLFNPSACFATRKVLKEYKAGKCMQIGVTENVDFSAQPVVPEKKKSSGSSADMAGNAANVSKVPKQVPTLEQLTDENARLKAEISRLKTENEQLRKAGR